MGKCFAACISLLCWAIVTSSSFASISISKYDPLVKKHARRYGFDWRLPVPKADRSNISANVRLPVTKADRPNHPSVLTWYPMLVPLD